MKYDYISMSMPLQKFAETFGIEADKDIVKKFCKESLSPKKTTECYGQKYLMWRITKKTVKLVADLGYWEQNIDEWYDEGDDLSQTCKEDAVSFIEDSYVSSLDDSLYDKMWEFLDSGDGWNFS